MFRRKPQPTLQPAWIVVGLGNPGGEYRGTRHNVGFDVVDRLAERHRIRLDRSRYRARYGLGTIGEVPVLLVKPLTFMNLSGQAVAPFAREMSLPPARILVVADDLSLEVGTLRLRAQGSAGGHNGHKSIIDALRTQEYPRLKIGIGSAGGDAISHVLGPFGREEIDVIREAIASAAQACECVLERGVEACMNEVNVRRSG